MVRVTSVGVVGVLNSSPFTDTVLPTASCDWFGKSSKFMFESVMTVMVFTGGVAPVNRAERPVNVNVPLLELMLATWPVICEGHKRTRSVVTVTAPPEELTILGRICT